VKRLKGKCFLLQAEGEGAAPTAPCRLPPWSWLGLPPNGHQMCYVICTQTRLTNRNLSYILHNTLTRQLPSPFKAYLLTL